MEIQKNEIDFIDEAANYLENPGWLLRAGSWAGKPLDSLQKSLPPKMRDAVGEAVSRTLITA